MCEPELTAENQGLLCAQGGHSNPPSCLWEPQTATYLTFRPGVTWEGNFSFSKAEEEGAEICGVEPRPGKSHRASAQARGFERCGC